ncbi:mechanosensitive ion channel domain-containing protein [Roseinatronobacter sp. S2]|uniref:mechanosensitive ion channel domain-containing protein n=1 Tax=Roseinatronobacter sp. S2 TaxID=3035471 RepID=UPI00240F9476|nr:mechanosensitive ion channel domain-containing protein [Roseinatronobacter sp. S2]WFE76489.1 mechanosensitive ion channel [Roseinatronobacter sp. S2]
MLLRVLLFWLAFTLPALAQTATEGANQTSGALADSDVARMLADILRDDDARETLIRQLESAAQTDGDAAMQVAPDAPPEMSFARQIAEQTRDVAENATNIAVSLMGNANDLLGLFTGESRVNWTELTDSAVALALVMAVTIGLFFALRSVGQRIFGAMSRRTGGGWLLSVVWLAGSSLIDALIIVLAWGGGYSFALFTGEAGSMDFRQSLFLNAFLLVEMSKVVLRGILSPRYANLRFAPMSDETAAYWYFWTSRLVSLLGYGALLVVPIINAAVSFAVGHSVLILLVVTALVIATLIILQSRDAVATALRARYERDPADMIGRAEAMAAGVWHWLAIAYLLALFIVWVTRPTDALQFMLMATLNSVIAIVIGVVVMAFISRAITGGMRVPGDLRAKLPLLEDRLNAFVPSILRVVRVLVVIAVLISIAQSWQFMDFLSWAASEVGRDVVGRLASAAFVVLMAMAVWLGLSSFVEYRLNPAVGTVPTARERTLLALLRNALTIALIIIASMLTLAELGVNIAPLLAGAGVLGLAIGFGAQKLVQDIITGAFIQFENAMNEGDVVTAGGTTGVVEKLTVRSVGLRDVSGTYHLIPFSSVDMVSNFMKGFAFHVAEIGVAYREDISEVRRLMHRAYDILAEGEHANAILEPLDIQGIVSLGDSAVVVRGRIKTQPGMQWAVGRAYTEIVKQVLDEAGIEIPFPHMTLYMGQDKDGSAPPLNLLHASAQPAIDAKPDAAPARDVPEPAKGAARKKAGGSDKGDQIERHQPGSDEAEQN